MFEFERSDQGPAIVLRACIMGQGQARGAAGYCSVKAQPEEEKAQRSEYDKENGLAYTREQDAHHSVDSSHDVIVTDPPEHPSTLAAVAEKVPPGGTIKVTLATPSH